MRYAKVDVEPLLDVEGGLEKVGPNGLPVRTTLERHTFEGDQEISDSQAKWMQTQEDGTKMEVQPLERTASVDIREERSLEEVTLDAKASYGTTIPRESVSKYATDSVYSMWADEGWALRLAEYLEKQKLAALFPFTFGRGFKIYTCTAYPIRMGSKVYLLVHFNTGEILLRHPLDAGPATAEEPQKRVILVAPRLRKKTTTGTAS